MVGGIKKSKSRYSRRIHCENSYKKVKYIGNLSFFIWAWQNRKWSSEHEFLLVQKTWYNWGVGITIAGAIMGLTPFLFLGCGI